MENTSDDFPQQKKLENLLPNFAGSSPPISPKTSPTSLWKSLVLIFWRLYRKGVAVHLGKNIVTKCCLGCPLPVVAFLGNENSARSFSDRSFFSPPSGHGRPRLRVMDVRTEMLVFPGFRGPDRSFCRRTSAGISAWTSAGYPAPKLTLWAAFSFLTFGFQRHMMVVRSFVLPLQV